MSYSQLNQLFKNNRFNEINENENAYKFYLLRSISKKKDLRDFCSEYAITYENNTDSLLDAILESSLISVQTIETYLRSKYIDFSNEEVINLPELITQLNLLETFDWGGSFQNSLEKNIVNRYVKKIRNYEILIDKLNGELTTSLRGYTLNSWYNHWTSILIENIFKDNQSVLPTVGQIEKIDFFINTIPFDLKVTYFPKELMKEKLRDSGYGNELTRVKKISRELNIPIPSHLSDESLNAYLQRILNESVDSRALDFLIDLNNRKAGIIENEVNNPLSLITWLYEKQGERRFDASNRIFLVLVDRNNMFDSWKLKRNLDFLQPIINDGISRIIRGSIYDVNFLWENNHFITKSAIIWAIRD